MQFPSRGLLMLYALYQATADLAQPIRAWAMNAGGMAAGAGAVGLSGLRPTEAACEMISRATLTHRRPSFGIDAVTMGNREVAVQEEATLTKPFGTLLRFVK